MNKVPKTSKMRFNESKDRSEGEGSSEQQAQRGGKKKERTSNGRNGAKSLLLGESKEVEGSGEQSSA